MSEACEQRLILLLSMGLETSVFLFFLKLFNVTIGEHLLIKVFVELTCQCPKNA